MTECSRCGDCCESMFLSSTKRRLREMLGETDTSDSNVANAEFILEHWHGGVANGPGRTKRWACDAFDPVSRLCTAHEDRPPVCSGFPWYGRDPYDLNLSPRCSFREDIPVELRRK